MPKFIPEQSLVAGTADPHCRAVVIVPARNEEVSLVPTLNALAAQVDLQGKPLDYASYEVLLLLNNCTDASAEVARAWKSAHSDVRLQIAERTLAPGQAHIGTARRWLMDTAWRRLRERNLSSAQRGILSTDSDTVVAPDWVAQNLRALALGADAVGGVIELKPGELEKLPEGARKAYRHDRTFQRLQAELEDLLDPQLGDPWPRHLEHFGASLACTPEVYARAGGLPPVNPLEDMAFADALYRVDARLRHDPGVRVFTSARLNGRASVGLSWQLRTWQAESEAGEPHQVACALWLAHRFRSLRYLRELYRSRADADLRSLEAGWRARVRKSLAQACSTGEFLAKMDCDAWIDQTYTGHMRDEDVRKVNRDLRLAIARARQSSRKTATGPHYDEGMLTGAVSAATRAAAGRSGTAQLDGP